MDTIILIKKQGRIYVYTRIHDTNRTRQALTEQFLKACPLDGQYERFTRPIDNRTRPPQM